MNPKVLIEDYSEKALIQLMVAQHNLTNSQAVFTANILKFIGYSDVQRYQIVMNNMGIINSMQRVGNLWCFFIVAFIVLAIIAYCVTNLLYKTFFGWWL